jgi:predicted SnoaL-like aldol condensation-catalyzing enzyme
MTGSRARAQGLGSRTPGANAELVRAAFQRVFSEHQIGDIDLFFAEDFVQHSPYVAWGGRAELAQWLATTVNSIPNLRYVITDVVAAGNAVVVFATVTGTIEHDLPDYGIRGSGQATEFRTAHLLRLRDGMIAGHWEVVDTGPLVALALTPAASTAGG